MIELEQGIDNDDSANGIEKRGDVLFALTNLARRLCIDPAAALEATNQIFIRRFEHIEQSALREGSHRTSEPLTILVVHYRQTGA